MAKLPNFAGLTGDYSALKRDRISRLENSAISPENKALSLLVYAGEKPAAELVLAHHVYDPAKKLLYLERDYIQHHESVFQSLGLSYHVKRFVGGPYNDCFDSRVEDGFYKEYIIFLIGGKNSMVNKLRRALENGDPFTEGILLGYPPTAVRAEGGQSESHMRFRGLDEQEPPIPECPFSQFVFSKGHYFAEFNSTSKR